MGDQYQIMVPSIFVRDAADDHAEATNQLLYGETVMVVDDSNPSWLQIESSHDSYPGFIPTTAIGKAYQPSHKVCVGLTHVYEQPDFKSPILSPLFFQSYVQSNGQTENGFYLLDQGGWIFKDHLSKAETVKPDFVETALMFEGAPYVWGGRSVSGIDCSGLVQISLMAAGIDTPRDTKQQDQSVGAPVLDQPPGLERGDLVFFDRHVGIMLDGETMINATSRHMQVVREKLSDVEKAYKGVRAIRRVSAE